MVDMVSKKHLLKEIMTVDFVLKELNLYLDTHPCSKEALEMFKQYENKSKQLVCSYEKLFGPLTPSANNNDESWEWIKGPWPWENC